MRINIYSLAVWELKECQRVSHSSKSFQQTNVSLVSVIMLHKYRWDFCETLLVLQRARCPANKTVKRHVFRGFGSDWPHWLRRKYFITVLELSLNLLYKIIWLKQLSYHTAFCRQNKKNRFHTNAPEKVHIFVYSRGPVI